MASSTDSDPNTLTRFILAEQKRHQEAKGDLTILMMSVQLACKVISSAVRKAGISGLYGLQGAVNVQGEDVKKLDVIANDNFINTLKHSQQVAVMVSEENEEPIIIHEAPNAKYCVVFDPLDGSSNIDCNISVGSIFGIYRRDPSRIGKTCTVDDVLRSGANLAAAGYCMYGSSTQMVLTVGEGVHVFTLDPSIGEFLLTERDVKIPEQPKAIYSVNEGNISSFPEPVKKFVDECKSGKKPYSLRYVGSMVADVHRTLLYGGVFMYPASQSSPNGKLRLLYECNPMSMLIEQAGGAATTGTQRIMDIVPTSIHERAPTILGSTRDVNRLTELFKESGITTQGT